MPHRVYPLRAGKLLLVMAAAPLVTACGGAGWQADPDLLAPPRKVAAALGDPLRPGEDVIDPTGIPVLDPPTHVRPCCQLGMDQRVKLGGAEVPGYSRGNILGVDELGAHSYDSGLVPLTADEHGVDVENNGVLYTCRGGFVDTAHIRDYTDWTFYVALRVARSLPEGSTIEVPGDGAARRVVLRPVPPELVAKRGRLATAGILAQWIVHRIAVWHEIASWYGVEGVKGFSEKGSAFSPEDLYSNILGIKIGAALASDQVPRTLEEYNLAVDAWISAVLRRLDVLPRPAARAAMKAVDGLWWDSNKFLPDPTTVRRRHMDIGSRQAAWLLEDGLPHERVPAVVKEPCEEAGAPLVLTVPEVLGAKRIADMVTVEIEPEAAPSFDTFPFPRPGDRRLTSDDFPAVVEAMREDMRRVLGDGFDRPGGGPARE
jgi:hypothetical protein